MIILKQVEFGKRNKGGGKTIENRSSNAFHSKAHQQELERRAAETERIKEAGTLKGKAKELGAKVVKGGKAAVEAISKNKKTAGIAAAATITAAGAAVAGKKAYEKKRKVYSSRIDENGEEKLFSVKDIAEDTSTAAALGAGGALAYTGVQGAKALKAAHDAAKLGDGNVKEQLQIAGRSAKAMTKEQLKAAMKKEGLKTPQLQAKAARALQKAGKGSKVAASAAAASIVAGAGAKLLGKKKDKK